MRPAAWVLLSFGYALPNASIHGHSRDSWKSNHLKILSEVKGIIDHTANDPRWRPLDGPFAHSHGPKNKAGEVVAGIGDGEVTDDNEWHSYRINTDAIHGGDENFRYRTSTTTTTTFTTTTPGMRNASNSSGLGRNEMIDFGDMDAATKREVNPKAKARIWNHKSDRQRKNKVMTIKEPRYDGLEEDGTSVEGFHYGKRDETDQYSVWNVSNSWQRGWCFDRRTYRMADDTEFGSHTNLNCATYCLVNYDYEDAEESLQPMSNVDIYDVDIGGVYPRSGTVAMNAWATGKSYRDFRCMRDLPWWEHCDTSTNGQWRQFHNNYDQWPNESWYRSRSDGRLCPLGQSINPVTGITPFTTNYEESYTSDDMLNPIMSHDELNPAPGLDNFVEDYAIGTTNLPERDTHKMRCGHSIVPGFLMDLTSTDSFVQPDTASTNHPTGYWPECSEERPWICDGEWTWDGPFGKKTEEAKQDLALQGSAEWPDRVFGHPNIKFNYFDEALLRKAKAWHDSDFPTWRIGLVSEEMSRSQNDKYALDPAFNWTYFLDGKNSPWTTSRVDILSRMNWVEERWQSANACQHRCELTPGCNSFVHFDTMHQNWQIGYNHKTGEGISCLLKFDIQNRNLLEDVAQIPERFYATNDYHTSLKRNRCAAKSDLPNSGPGTANEGCDGEIMTEVPLSDTPVKKPERWLGSPFCPLRWWNNRPSKNDPNGQWGENPLTYQAHRFEGLGPGWLGEWDVDHVEGGKCVFKDSTVQAGPKSCIIQNGSIDTDHRDPFELYARATTYQYMESIPRAVSDYQHVSGVDQVVEWDHTRGKDGWRGFNKIMQFHRAEVSINTSVWHMKGWYDYVGDEGEKTNTDRRHATSWAAPFDPASGLPPVSGYSDGMVTRTRHLKSTSRRLSEGSMTRDELKDLLHINVSSPTPEQLTHLHHDRQRLQEEFAEMKKKVMQQVQEADEAQTNETLIRLQPHQVARANVIRYLDHQVKHPKGRHFKEAGIKQQKARRLDGRKAERERKRQEALQRARASHSVFNAAKIHLNSNIGESLLKSISH